MRATQKHPAAFDASSCQLYDDNDAGGEPEEVH